MTYRRVITGHAGGRSTIVSDAPVEPLILPGVGQLYRMWDADQAATYPDAGINPNAPAVFPPIGGVRFFIYVLEPESKVALQRGSGLEDTAPDLEDVMGNHESGLHASDTTDFEVVIFGEAIVTMEDGKRVVLRQGDAIVHNGALHSWSNEGTVPAVLAGAMVGAHRTRRVS